jgi:hypothetical protein
MVKPVLFPEVARLVLAFLAGKSSAVLLGGMEKESPPNLRLVATLGAA